MECQDLRLKVEMDKDSVLVLGNSNGSSSNNSNNKKKSSTSAKGHSTARVRRERMDRHGRYQEPREVVVAGAANHRHYFKPQEPIKSSKTVSKKSVNDGGATQSVATTVTPTKEKVRLLTTDDAAVVTPQTTNKRTITKAPTTTAIIAAESIQLSITTAPNKQTPVNNNAAPHNTFETVPGIGLVPSGPSPPPQRPTASGKKNKEKTADSITTMTPSLIATPVQKVKDSDEKLFGAAVTPPSTNEKCIKTPPTDNTVGHSTEEPEHDVTPCSNPNEKQTLRDHPIHTMNDMPRQGTFVQGIGLVPLRGTTPMSTPSPKTTTHDIMPGVGTIGTATSIASSTSKSNPAKTKETLTPSPATELTKASRAKIKGHTHAVISSLKTSNRGKNTPKRPKHNASTCVSAPLKTASTTKVTTKIMTRTPQTNTSTPFVKKNGVSASSIQANSGSSSNSLKSNKSYKEPAVSSSTTPLRSHAKTTRLSKEIQSSNHQIPIRSAKSMPSSMRSPRQEPRSSNSSSSSYSKPSIRKLQQDLFGEAYDKELQTFYRKKMKTPDRLQQQQRKQKPTKIVGSPPQPERWIPPKSVASPSPKSTQSLRMPLSTNSNESKDKPPTSNNLMFPSLSAAPYHDSYSSKLPTLEKSVITSKKTFQTSPHGSDLPSLPPSPFYRSWQTLSPWPIQEQSREEQQQEERKHQLQLWLETKKQKHRQEKQKQKQKQNHQQQPAFAKLKSIAADEVPKLSSTAKNSNVASVPPLASSQQQGTFVVNSSPSSLLQYIASPSSTEWEEHAEQILICSPEKPPASPGSNNWAAVYTHFSNMLADSDDSLLERVSNDKHDSSLGSSFLSEASTIPPQKQNPEDTFEDYTCIVLPIEEEEIPDLEDVYQTFASLDDESHHAWQTKTYQRANDPTEPQAFHSAFELFAAEEPSDEEYWQRFAVSHTLIARPSDSILSETWDPQTPTSTLKMIQEATGKIHRHYEQQQLRCKSSRRTTKSEATRGRDRSEITSPSSLASSIATATGYGDIEDDVVNIIHEWWTSMQEQSLSLPPPGHELPPLVEKAFVQIMQQKRSDVPENDAGLLLQEWWTLYQQTMKPGEGLSPGIGGSGISAASKAPATVKKMDKEEQQLVAPEEVNESIDEDLAGLQIPTKAYDDADAIEHKELSEINMHSKQLKMGSSLDSTRASSSLLTNTERNKTTEQTDVLSRARAAEERLIARMEESMEKLQLLWSEQLKNPGAGMGDGEQNLVQVMDELSQHQTKLSRLRETRYHYLKKDKASIKIQSWWRMMVKRKNFEQLCLAWDILPQITARRMIAMIHGNRLWGSRSRSCVPTEISVT